MFKHMRQWQVASANPLAKRRSLAGNPTRLDHQD
jgi:hypothetical protein